MVALKRSSTLVRPRGDVAAGPNRDDVLKNHGFVRAADGGWRLSPAFDIVPQPDMCDVQAIGLGIMGGLPT
ncbi:HipA-like C-terminal domain-containing protein, partial [Methylobacterium sp. ap11]|uniref:HipA domain-containing protein n=1 Tax=Methylobacterium sp. ap11 TaxID=1761799 RepID=UPI0008AB5240